MEKLVLSNGAEYLLCTDGVNSYNGTATFKVRPLEGETKTTEDVLTDFTGNDTITAKIDDTSIRVITGMTVATSVSLIPNYVIDTNYLCPECGATVENTATTCDTCNATFDAPTMNEVIANIYVVIVSSPDVNDRLSTIETSIDLLGSAILDGQVASLLDDTEIE